MESGAEGSSDEFCRFGKRIALREFTNLFFAEITNSFAGCINDCSLMQHTLRCVRDARYINAKLLHRRPSHTHTHTHTHTRNAAFRSFRVARALDATGFVAAFLFSGTPENRFPGHARAKLDEARSLRARAARNELQTGNRGYRRFYLSMKGEPRKRGGINISARDIIARLRSSVCPVSRSRLR